MRGHTIRLAGVMLVPNVPFRRMRLLALVLSPRGFLAFNENLNHFMLRPGSIPTIARHIAWRVANALRWSVRATRKADWGLLAQYGAATVAGIVRSVGLLPADALSSASRRRLESRRQPGLAAPLS